MNLLQLTQDLDVYLGTTTSGATTNTYDDNIAAINRAYQLISTKMLLLRYQYTTNLSGPTAPLSQITSTGGMTTGTTGVTLTYATMDEPIYCLCTPASYVTGGSPFLLKKMEYHDVQYRWTGTKQLPIVWGFDYSAIGNEFIVGAEPDAAETFTVCWSVVPTAMSASGDTPHNFFPTKFHYLISARAAVEELNKNFRFEEGDRIAKDILLPGLQSLTVLVLDTYLARALQREPNLIQLLAAPVKPGKKE